MKPVRWGNLDAWVIPPRSSQGSSGNPEITSCVVLLHGYGAPGTDLVPLAHAVDAPPGTLFVFPQAPHALDDGEPGPYAGRAWWPIDMARLQVAALTGRLEQLADEHPAGMDEARALLAAFLDEMLGSLGLSGNQLLLGGFSQGAMLSCDLALRDPRPLAGLALLSGTTLC